MTSVQLIGWILSAAYVVAFGLLTALAARRAGRSLWLFDRPGQALPAWMFRLGFAALVLWPLATSARHPSPIWLIPAALGAGLALWAQVHMGVSWRIGAADGQTGTLVTDGPFSLSRNPVFVGMLLLVWALVPLAGPVLLLAAVAMTAAAVAQVRTEEAVLCQDAAWRDYAAHVPRWFGRA